MMTAVYSCVRILAEAIAGLPLHLYKYTENGGKEIPYYEVDNVERGTTAIIGG